MIDLFLKAADQAALYAALDSAGLMVTNDQGQSVPRLASHAHALDVIGDLVKTPAVYAEQPVDDYDSIPVLVTPAVMVGAYHANLRLLQPNATIQAALAGVTIAAPANAQRVWA